MAPLPKYIQAFHHFTGAFFATQVFYYKKFFLTFWTGQWQCHLPDEVFWILHIPIRVLGALFNQI